MALFFLRYDLRNGRDYQKITNKLEEFNAVRILESCWCFKRVDTTAQGLRNYFKQFVDGDDGLIVSQIAEINGVPQWASWNALGTPNDLK